MSAPQALISFVYVVALLAAVGALFALLTRRLPARTMDWVALTIACVLLGPVAASAATPDWNPFTMLGLYAPFLVVALAAMVFGRREGRRPQA
jgi:uncharacterized membrane protein YhaH (DUF805 family)